MDKFNRFFSFLFINSTINSLLSIWKITPNLSPEPLTNALNAKSIYKIQIRRYLGLGFLLSFIPGTDAFKSREALLRSIVVLEASVAVYRRALYGVALKEPASYGSALYVTFRPLFILYRYLHNMIFNRGMQFLIEPEGLELFEKAPEGLNPLNLFFYVLHFFSYLLVGTIDQADKIANSLPSPLKYLVIGLSGIAYWLLATLAGISFILFIVAELVLNSLNTLLIEPVKFVFEIIHQTVQTWELEFAYFPTKESEKLNNLIDAVENEQVNKALDSNIRSVKTSEQVLITGSKKAINTIENHHNSFFFQKNKDGYLFQRSKSEIRNVYNLPIVAYLMRPELLKIFPKELIGMIFSTCFELNAVGPKKMHRYIAEDDEREDRGFEI